MATTTLPTTLARIKPGDLIGFSGRSLLAHAINLGSLGVPFLGLSHVGIVGHLGYDLVLYESTTTVDDMPCLVRGEVVTGVQCHPIADRVEAFSGRVWHYPLRRPLPAEQAKWLAHRLESLCLNACPYDYIGAWNSRSMLIALAMRAKFGKEDLREVFCSEMVAHEWAAMNILKTWNASRWNPNGLARYAVRHGITHKPTEVVQ